MFTKKTTLIIPTRNRYKLLIKTLNWKPKLNLKNMCKDGWNWQQKNPNGYS